MSDQMQPRKPTLEPAPNHKSGPDVPKTEQNIPLTPFLDRPAPYTSNSYSPRGSDLSTPSTWHSMQQQSSGLPTHVSLQYRRFRRNGYRQVPTLPGPTLAGIGIDRQDTPRNLSSINAMLDPASEQPVARPLLPTPHSSMFSPQHWMILTGSSTATELGFDYSQDSSTPRGSSTSTESMSSPLTARLRSPFDRRNALANIRSPITPAPTDIEFEDQSGAVDTRLRSMSRAEIGGTPPGSPPHRTSRAITEARKIYRPSRFVEHLDISASPQYFDQEKQEDGGYDGDDEKGA